MGLDNFKVSFLGKIPLFFAAGGGQKLERGKLPRPAFWPIPERYPN